MTDTKNQPSNSNPIDVAIKLGLLALLALLCILIFKPFLAIMVWGIIIGVAVYPLFNKLTGLFGGRRKLTAWTMALLAIALLLVPTFLFFESLIDGVSEVAHGLRDGTLTIPPPSDKVDSWPLIGKHLKPVWQSAHEDLPDTLAKYAPQLKKLGEKVSGLAGGLAFGVLQFVISIIIAALFMLSAEGNYRTAKKIFHRLVGDRDEEFVMDTVATIRSIAQGVLGIAVIQSILCGVGMLIAGVPLAGLWTLLVLILAIVQLPPLLVMGPIIVYVFSASSTGMAIFFLIYGLIASSSDMFLKPLLLGRGVDVPMLVILIGAIGGMMVFGIIGLFLGGVVLALGYKLLIVWMNDGELTTPEADAIAS